MKILTAACLPSDATHHELQGNISVYHAHGYATEVWTGKRVARLIEEEFGVAYNPTTCPSSCATSWVSPGRGTGVGPGSWTPGRSGAS